MSFMSFSFLLLFLAVFAARLTVGSRKVEPAYHVLLLVAGAIFCAWDYPPYLVVPVWIGIVNYSGARILGAMTPGTFRRRLVFWLIIGANLVTLGLFKYAAFGTTLIQQGLAAMGIHAALSRPDILVPIGISFYTFQSMSHTIDAYRGQLPPVRGFWRFCLMVSFFPRFVSGPIVRSREFLRQIDRPRRLNWPVFTQGGWLLVQGLFLKAVCADNLSLFVGRHWGGRETDASCLVLAALFFSCQIFADLAGYTCIARGLSYWLGYRLPENFNNPYLAPTFASFWQRWHITLSQWLRDYLFLPISYTAMRWLGRVRSLERVEVHGAYVAGAVGTMFLAGLWHGAGFPFVVWGLIHGVSMSVERLLGFQKVSRRSWRRRLRGPWFVVVQLTVLVAWVFFRSASIRSASVMLGQIIRGPYHPLPPDGRMAALFAAPILAMHVHGWLRERDLVPAIGLTSKALMAAGMLLAVFTCYGTSNAFIYFQF